MDTPSHSVRRYTPADLSALAEVAAAVVTTEAPYPPPEAGRTVAELTQWLNSGTPLVRWVAEVADRVVGHVQLTRPYPYLLRHLAAHDGGSVEVEVGRLFVHPDLAGAGVGRSLLETALDYARTRELPAGLAVIDGSGAAERLYRRTGLAHAGSFTGIHGLNHVYVEDRPHVSVTDVGNPA